MVQLEGRHLRMDLILDLNLLSDAGRWDVDQDGRVRQHEAELAGGRVAALIQPHFYVTANGVLRLDPALRSSRSEEDGAAVLVYEFTLPEVTEFVQIHASLEDLTDPHHRHLMRVTVEGETVQHALGHGANDVRINPSRLGYGTAGRMLRFARLGVEHILSGYDHLVFLAGLLVTTLSVGPLVRVVTAFTLAHSITLALATLEIMVLPDRFVEAVIALTIAYVALENLWLKSFDKRWRVTFVFELLHGFGFSNVLRELALPRPVLAASLFSFNLGVEVGQLVVVLAVFPLVRWMGGTRLYEPAKLAFSALIFACGLFWFTERILT